jgi:hypothetical protein
MIYEYLPPLSTLLIDYKYAEVGTYPTPVLSYTITKRTLSTETTALSNMIPSSYPSIVSNKLLLVEHRVVL